MLPFLIILGAAGLAVVLKRRGGPGTSLLPGLDLSPPKIDPWRTNLLANRLQEHANALAEAEVIDFARQAFGDVDLPASTAAPATPPKKPAAAKKPAARKR